MNKKDKKKVYFIGIAGKAMAPLAKTFRDLGWEVSGSDKKEVYPPISLYLEENKIFYFKGYAEGNVPSDADLVVVSRPSIMFDKDNPEYLKAKTLDMLVLSYPEVLQKFLVKENSIVVAGTFGKTTISCLITWILINAGFDPSYMIGGVPLNMNDGVKITDSEYSVVEGDETPSLLENDPPKFMFYEPKNLLISATQHDHPEVFRTKEEYSDAFLKLVKLLPDDGLLVYNQESVEPRVVEAANCRKISYSFESNQADYFLKTYTVNKNKTGFCVGYYQNIFSSETRLLGKHNLQNICGAVALCSELGVKKEIIDKAIKSFKGVKTRIEFLKEASGRFIYWDLAQHPSKVAGTLQAIRENYPNNRIFCVFDPSMTGLKYKESLEWYPGAFDEADKVVVGKVGFLRNLKKEDRVSGKEITEAIAKTQKNVFYEPMEEKLIGYLLKESRVGDVIIFMSSGGLRFTRMIEEIVKKLKKDKGEQKDPKYPKIIEILGGDKVKLNEPMLEHTTFKIGGPADLFYVAEKEEDLVRVLREVRELRIPYFILGGGSNVLVGDKGFRGMIIKIKNKKLKIKNEDEKFIIMAEAGVSLRTLVDKAVEDSLTGLEFAAGIPGTVGGAVRGNAGAWQKNIGDLVSRVKIIKEDGKVEWLKKEDCDFGYRNSRFKKSEEIILEVELEMNKGDKKKIEGQVKENLEKRTNQPKEPSAGCIFINPKPASAGELIEKCELKGVKIGNAQISQKHANFIINLGGAKAQDVVTLIDLIKNKVKGRFNLDLKEEIVRIGEF